MFNLSSVCWCYAR